MKSSPRKRTPKHTLQFSNDVPLSANKSRSERKIEENDGKIEKDSVLSNAKKNNNARAKPKKVPVSCKVNEHCMNLEMYINTINLENKEFDADIPLPQGTSLITIADIEGLNYLLKMLDIFSNF